MNYNINTIPSLTQFLNENWIDDSIVFFYWKPNDTLMKKLVDFFQLIDKKKILDVGGAMGVFKHATHVIDIIEDLVNNIYKVDLDFDKFPFDNQEFQFTYCRHTIEDVQNPSHTLDEIFRTSFEGYIETPSPLVEFTQGVDAGSVNYKGYIHHRYLVWSSLKDNTLHILPKYPIIETIITNAVVKKKMNYLLNNYPLYWNNYYLWNKTDKKPNVILYRHGVNMDIRTDYLMLINMAIEESIDYANHVVNDVFLKT